MLERVEFHNTGTDQVPGLIVMTVDDTVRTDLDPDRNALIVIINSTDEEQTFTIDGVSGARLHPVQAESTPVPEPSWNVTTQTLRPTNSVKCGEPKR